MDTEYTRLIERFFDQTLSTKEVDRVHQLLKTNDDFKQEFERFEQSHKIVDLFAQSELKRTIAKMDKKTTHNSSLKWLKVAAGMVIVATTSLVLYAQLYLSETKIVARHFQIAEDYVTNLDSELTPLESAMQFYNTGQYEKAFEALSSIDQEQAYFYKGQCLLQLNNPDGAIIEFDMVNGLLKPEAMWYTSLAFLKLGKEIECRTVLSLIIKENNDALFVNNALQLMEELQNPLRVLVF